MICNIRLYKLNWLDLVNSKTLSLLSTNIAVNRLTSWLNVGSRHTKPSSKNCWRTTSASPPLACNSGHIVALELSTNASWEEIPLHTTGWQSSILVIQIGISLDSRATDTEKDKTSFDKHFHTNKNVSDKQLQKALVSKEIFLSFSVYLLVHWTANQLEPAHSPQKLVVKAFLFFSYEKSHLMFTVLSGHGNFLSWWYQI